ncbi:MAG: ribonuclease J [Candidatus Pacebacteria bacterium]|nr:ribonuclease J [Candidatus Paceibacterota bacterium]
MTEIKKRDTIEIKKKKKSYQKKPNIFDNRMNKGTYKTSISLLGPKKVNPKIEDDRIRILTIGGFEEVGKNMMAVESKDSIYIFDAGFEFATDEEAPGIDYTLPNIQHLKENKHKIKALIITHGHLDHIGAIPFLMEELGNPPIYCRKLTSLLIKKRMEEFPNIPEIKIFVVDFKDNLKIGELSFEFFEVTHSIPDSMGISIKTKFGNIVITGDLKLTHTDGEPSEKEKSV